MSKKETQKLIMNILGTKPIAFNADLAHALGSVDAGLLLSQLLYWDGKGWDPDWIYKTMKMIKKETGLSRREQDRAIKICKKYNLIEVKLKGIPAKRSFKIRTENIVELLGNYFSSLSETDKQVCPKAPNSDVYNEQSNTKNNIDNNKEGFLKTNFSEAYKNGDKKHKPFYRGFAMRWVPSKNKWYVIQHGEWLEFADKENKIEWK